METKGKRKGNMTKKAIMKYYKDFNEIPYAVPIINNKADYLEFKDNIQAHDSSSAIDNKHMALELHIGQAIVEFYKPKYEKNKPQANERNK